MLFLNQPFAKAKKKNISHSNEKGQSLVEFSLMVVILTILLLGILDVGRAYFTYLAMQDAAGEGANYAAQHPTYVTSVNSALPNNITYRVQQAAPSGTLVDWNSACIGVETPATVNQGNTITVTVTSNHALITPFIGTIVGNQSLKLRAMSVAVISTSAQEGATAVTVTCP